MKSVFFGKSCSNPCLVLSGGRNTDVRVNIFPKQPDTDWPSNKDFKSGISISLDSQSKENRVKFKSLTLLIIVSDLSGPWRGSQPACCQLLGATFLGAMAGKSAEVLCIILTQDFQYMRPF